MTESETVILEGKKLHESVVVIDLDGKLERKSKA